jgi:hypothetical protein
MAVVPVQAVPLFLHGALSTSLRRHLAPPIRLDETRSSVSHRSDCHSCALAIGLSAAPFCAPDLAICQLAAAPSNCTMPSLQSRWEATSHATSTRNAKPGPPSGSSRHAQRKDYPHSLPARQRTDNVAELLQRHHNASRGPRCRGMRGVRSRAWSHSPVPRTTRPWTGRACFSAFGQAVTENRATSGTVERR